MATIKDVAREAGVAVGTVSRYLNGAEIKEANRKKIDDAVHRLHFRLNPIARGLKTSRTNTIGVIIPDLSDPYSTTIVRSIEQKLYECGYNMFTCDSWGNPELERQKVELLMQQRVDGLILYPCA
jgi:LacI family transcriptional regulator